MSIILLFLGVLLISLLIFGFLKSKQFIEHLIKNAREGSTRI